MDILEMVLFVKVSFSMFVLFHFNLITSNFTARVGLDTISK